MEIIYIILIFFLFISSIASSKSHDDDIDRVTKHDPSHDFDDWG